MLFWRRQRWFEVSFSLQIRQDISSKLSLSFWELEWDWDLEVVDLDEIDNEAIDVDREDINTRENKVLWRSKNGLFEAQAVYKNNKQ